MKKSITAQRCRIPKKGWIYGTLHICQLAGLWQSVGSTRTYGKRKNYVQASETADICYYCWCSLYIVPVKGRKYPIMATVLHLWESIWKISFLLSTQMLGFLFYLTLFIFYYQHSSYCQYHLHLSVVVCIYETYASSIILMSINHLKVHLKYKQILKNMYSSKVFKANLFFQKCQKNQIVTQAYRFLKANLILDYRFLYPKYRLFHRKISLHIPIFYILFQTTDIVIFFPSSGNTLLCQQ